VSPQPIRVLIVDDSSLVRQTLSDVLASDDGITVMAGAADPFEAAALMRKQVPDVMILDVAMPRMDGLTFLRRVMTQHPIPTIVCSSMTWNNSPAALSAIDLGAVDVIEKPNVATAEFFEEAKVRFCDAVKAAARARLRGVGPRPESSGRLESAERSAKPMRRPARGTDRLVVAGASTGGIEALQIMLRELPPSFCGIAVVQHMPAGFTAAFADRLDADCSISVKEARDGDAIEPGLALIAPGDRHMAVRRVGSHYHVEVTSGPLVNRHRPSVDVLFESAADAAGANAVGVIMTGMGEDGSRGLLKLRRTGAQTIAQDEATCVVYGMPAAAVRLGAVGEILPIDAIAGALMRKCGTP
jgi:two-component system chemotaxis response regulator CheB